MIALDPLKTNKASQMPKQASGKDSGGDNQLP